jgi:exopolyphosphatase/guanosine-5'-triphosphate,3'-diphosphate pyrophosphatase
VKIAAIDIGSNSIHMVVVEAGPRGSFRILDREKEMVRLGASTLADGRLSARAMKRGLETLARFKRLARSRGVEKIIAVATSALREAENGEAFVARAGREIGLWPRIISGEQEARLIHRAVVHSMHLGEEPFVSVDIGGGSVELTLGQGREVGQAASEKLGVLRMNERFLRGDPPAPTDVRRLAAHVQSVLSPHASEMRKRGFSRVVGTSGTILALGRLVRELLQPSAAESLHHSTIRIEALRTLRQRLLRMDLRARLKLRALDPGRADIVVAGVVILAAVLDLLGAREITLCEWALREGVLLDYLATHRRSVVRARICPDPRRRSVFELAERCRHDRAHARHVSGLALQIFDGLRPVHGLADAERELLEYAALLHDIGHHISYPAHHRHSYYLIKNGDLHGLTPVEQDMIACVARYHRQGRPRKSHPEMGSLEKSQRHTVALLAGILRVADALDRTHRQSVRSVTVVLRGRSVAIRGASSRECDLETWGARRRADLLARALGRVVTVPPTLAAARSRALPFVPPRLRRDPERPRVAASS